MLVALCRDDEWSGSSVGSEERLEVLYDLFAKA